jgi:hypothetical protein
MLCSWIKQTNSNFCVIDSLARTNPTGVDSQEGLGPSIMMLDRVATRTGACVLTLHHDRKREVGQRGDTDAASNARGPSNLIDNCRFAFNVDKHAGRRRVRWHKVTFGPEREDAFFTLDASGCPAESASPAEVAETNLSHVRAALRSVTRDGISAPISDIAAVVRHASGTNMSVRTIRRHLDALIELGEACQSGETRSRVYAYSDIRTDSDKRMVSELYLDN